VVRQEFSLRSPWSLQPLSSGVDTGRSAEYPKNNKLRLHQALHLIRKQDRNRFRTSSKIGERSLLLQLLSFREDLFSVIR
jgi:hypothetical protein